MPVLTIPKAFELAVQHHRTGRLGEAEALYRQILAYQPNHDDALHKLGVLSFQLGRGPEALQLLRRACGIRPKDADCHNDLGIVLASLGHASEALAAYRQAITLRPDFAEAHNNLANALSETNRLDEAVWAYRKAIARRPDFPEAHYNLANALAQLGRPQEAIAEYRQAIACRPEYPEAYNNLGIALQDQADLANAAMAFRQAIATQSNFPEAFNNLADTLRMQGSLNDASDACRQALSLRPAYAKAYNTLGLIQRDQGLVDEAITSYRQALSLRQNFPEACNNLANALRERGDLDQAIAAFRQALSLQPDYATAHSNLGNALKDAGRLDEAIESYRWATELGTDAELAGNLLYAVHFHPDYDPRRIYEEHIRWNHVYARPLASSLHTHENERSPERRLRVGYVSADLCAHPVARFLLPLLANHNRDAIEIFCYSGVRRPDAITERLKSQADAWRETVGIGDEQLARMIHDDRIDILVDLALHTQGSRLLAFARKPAPVQVTWLGYCSTTGLEAMDYRLTDPHFDPPSVGDEFYSEQSIRLPRTYWCYEPPEEAPEVGPLPAASAGYVTFGCLNNFGKVSEPALTAWFELLGRVPDSRLLLFAPEGEHRTRTFDRLAGAGIDPRRLQFVGPRPLQEYFEQYRRIDVALDPFPFSGGTTTCDALWMGVPVVSLALQTSVSRAGLSVLSNVGMPELVARDREAYIKIAVDLAGEIPRLAGLRSTLRGRMRSSPLMDGAQFARDVEAALRLMWRNWCDR